MKTIADRLVLVGMMGSGKTTVGRRLARALGWKLVDTDHEIMRRTGKTVSQIFAEKGEQFFRQLEKEEVHRLGKGRHCVIATGGGMVIDPENRQRLAHHGRLVYLKTSPKTLAKRLKEASDRPLLQGNSVRETLFQLLEARESAYLASHWTVETDGRTPAAIAQEILWRFLGDHSRVLDPALRVLVGVGCLRQLPHLLEETRVSTPILVLVDERVWRLSRPWLSPWLEEAFVKFRPKIVVWKTSERKKTLTTAHRLWKTMHEWQLERSSAVVAIGGGVLTDVAGFVASTYKRGVRLFLVPTTLLAQVDAAVGGKTGVNFGGAKNMIGTFYPADAVLLDPIFLLTLPEREFRAGMAEVIKAAILDGKETVGFLQQEIRSLRQRNLTKLTDAIQKAVQFKLRVVKEDLQERSGKRMLLNFGHTLGHVIEAYFQYRVKHGEAVAAGMVAAAKLGAWKRICSQTLVETLEKLLRQFRLPVKWPDVPYSAVEERVQHDKKRRDGRIRFVLPEDFGIARIVDIDLKAELRPFLERERNAVSEKGQLSDRSEI